MGNHFETGLQVRFQIDTYLVAHSFHLQLFRMTRLAFRFTPLVLMCLMKCVSGQNSGTVSCTTDQECTGSELCWQGSCRERTFDSPCESDAQCRNGYVCLPRNDTNSTETGQSAIKKCQYDSSTIIQQWSTMFIVIICVTIGLGLCCIVGLAACVLQGACCLGSICFGSSNKNRLSVLNGTVSVA